MGKDGSLDSLGIEALANKESVEENAYLPVFPPHSSVVFTSTTVALSSPTSFNSDPSANLSALDTSSNSRRPNLSGANSTPISAGLRLQTDVVPGYSVTSATDSNVSASRISAEFQQRPSVMAHPSRTPSVKHTLGTSVGSSSNLGSAPSSAMSSPKLNAMADVTPLPSPLTSGDSPGPWKRLTSRPTSREYILPGAADSALVTSTGESISSAIVNQYKRRAYHGLVTNADDPLLADNGVSNEKSAARHARNRSMSEYTPEALQVPRPRLQTVSGSHAIPSELVTESPSESHMRRERNLAVERGIAPVPEARLPTPPSSRAGAESSDSDSSVSHLANFNSRIKKPKYEYFEARTLDDDKRRRWRALKVLGQGTFSKVVLATSQAPDKEDKIDEDDVLGEPTDGISPQIEPKIDRKKLVAIKICEHGPKGGASEERVEMSLKRELEIMKSIHHPSVVHLKAFNIETTRAILVLSYCPGGDLFEVASEHRELLTPPLLRRVFAEIVAAVRYLHERHIVHRDIKLESESNKTH
jgi:protein-serine/threonine kinase